MLQFSTTPVSAAKKRLKSLWREKPARIVELVRAGDPEAVPALMLSTESEPRATSAQFASIVNAGLVDAVMSHFQHPAAAREVPAFNGAAIVHLPGAFLAILINLTTKVNGPRLPPAQLDELRVQVARALLSGALHLFAVGDPACPRVLWGDARFWHAAIPQVISVVSNVMLTREAREVLVPPPGSCAGCDLVRDLTAYCLCVRAPRALEPSEPAQRARYELECHNAAAAALQEVADEPRQHDGSFSRAALVALRHLNARPAPVYADEQPGPARKNPAGVEQAGSTTFAQAFHAAVERSRALDAGVDSCAYAFALMAHGGGAAADSAETGFGDHLGIGALAAHARRLLDAAPPPPSETLAEALCSMLVSATLGAQDATGMQPATDLPERVAELVSGGGLEAAIELLGAHARSQKVATTLCELIRVVMTVSLVDAPRRALRARREQLERALSARSVAGSPFGGVRSAASELLQRTGGGAAGSGAAGIAGVNVRCSRCRKAVPSSQIKRCARCKQNYCSAECQKDDWKRGNHREECARRQGVGPATGNVGGVRASALSAAGERVLWERLPAVLCACHARGLRFSDCMVIVVIEAETKAFPVTAEEFEAEHSGAGGEIDEENRAHTRAIFERNRAAGQGTAVVYALNDSGGTDGGRTRMLKTLPSTPPASGGAGSWDAVQEQCVREGPGALIFARGVPTGAALDTLLRRLRDEGISSALLSREDVEALAN